jgi:23S rRNA pseudouridine2605 synthase
MLHTMKKDNSRKPFFKDDKKSSDSPKSYGKSDFGSKGSKFGKDFKDSNSGSKGKYFGKKEDSFEKPSFEKKSDFKSNPWSASSGAKPKGRFFKDDGKKFDKPSFGKTDSERKPFGEKRFDKGEGFKKKFEKREDSDFGKKPSFGKKAEPFNREDFSEKKFERKTGEDYTKKSFGGKPDRFKKDDFGAKKFEKKGKQDFGKPFKKDFSEDKFSKPDPGERTVYKGRGRDEKPIFATEKRQFNEDKPQEKRGFGKNRPNRQELNPDRPDYNLEALPSKREKGKEQADTFRLNKYIANSGICSRREADDLIAQGLITVNGEVITEMGHKVKKSDRVIYQGKRINPEKPVYVLLNKPKDFITTTDDPMERKTVMKLVENACEERIFPVGRLDRNTTGLLLFTNDGELTAKLSHPSNEVKKIYQVTLDKPLTYNHEEEIRAGLTLEDGDVKVDDMQVLSIDRTILGLEIHIGRNRIVRRLFAHLGYEVTALDRVMYAGLDKKDLKRGHYRFLSEQEVIRLKYFV